MKLTLTVTGDYRRPIPRPVVDALVAEIEKHMMAYGFTESRNTDSSIGWKTTNLYVKGRHRSSLHTQGYATTRTGTANQPPSYKCLPALCSGTRTRTPAIDYGEQRRRTHARQGQGYRRRQARQASQPVINASGSHATGRQGKAWG